MTRLDVVCGEKVDEGIAEILGLTRHYNDRNYFFCSEQCMDEFQHNPQQFASNDPELQGESDSSYMPD